MGTLQVENVTENAVETYTLTAQDRCDSCQAQAYVITKHSEEVGRGLLHWCLHHYNKNEMKLLEFTVYDNRMSLVEDRARGDAHA